MHTYSILLLLKSATALVVKVSHSEQQFLKPWVVQEIPELGIGNTEFRDITFRHAESVEREAELSNLVCILYQY